MEINKTWNQHTIKKENKFLVLQNIRRNNPASRAEISNITGLNKGTVSSLVNELLEEKLIKEAGSGESKGGRRPVMLLFNKNAGNSIGIDLGVNYILGILTDLEGNIIEKKQTKFYNPTYKQILAKLFQIIDSLYLSSSNTPYGIVGIGIGVPGIVEKNQNILLTPNLKWGETNLKETLKKKYDTAIIIENEANAGVYGEKKFGTGKNNKNIVYVSVGIGIGVGLILNDTLYRGSEGFSGELGHMTIEMNGKTCSCQNQGCWELYASEKSLLSEAQKAHIQLPQKKELVLEHLVKLAETGDRKTIQLFNDIGRYLGMGINNIINIFNPEIVIIGNRMKLAKNWIENPINDWVNNKTLWFNKKELNISFSEVFTSSTALGAVALTIENFINS